MFYFELETFPIFKKCKYIFSIFIINALFWMFDYVYILNSLMFYFWNVFQVRASCSCRPCSLQYTTSGRFDLQNQNVFTKTTKSALKHNFKSHFDCEIILRPILIFFIFVSAHALWLVAYLWSRHTPPCLRIFPVTNNLKLLKS